MKYDVVVDTTKRLLIMLVLDISPSMRINNRIRSLIAAVKLLIGMLLNAPQVADKVEIAVVTYSTEVNDTGFVPLREWKMQEYATVPKGGSNMSGAVLKAYQLLEQRLQELDNADTDHYVPFMVLVTDGDPDKTDHPQRHQDRAG